MSVEKSLIRDRSDQTFFAFFRLLSVEQVKFKKS